MQARVWRLFDQGQRIERERLRRMQPAVGELVFRLRLTGRIERWDVFLAVLMHPSLEYVIPALDQARLVEIRGGWLHLEGTEVLPRGRSAKRIAVDRYKQEWWCRVASTQP